MNKYQKRAHSEIKESMKHFNGPQPLTYRQARRLWKLVARINWCRPCEDCDNSSCKGPYNKIAFCHERL